MQLCAERRNRAMHCSFTLVCLSLISAVDRIRLRSKRMHADDDDRCHEEIARAQVDAAGERHEKNN